MSSNIEEETMENNISPPPLSSASPPNHRKGHVVVIVLGDVGRSPRMQYHALSLLEEGYMVSLVGYEGTDLIPALCDNNDCSDNTVNTKNLNVIRFRVPSPKLLQKSLPIYLVWRILSLTLYLFYALLISVPRKASLAAALQDKEESDKQQLHGHQHKSSSTALVDCVLLQNPPAMPLMIIVYLYCKYNSYVHKHKTSMMIDWHNLGYTMLPNPSSISKMARLYEQFMSPLADQHLTVTKAMKHFLVERFRLPSDRIHVLYDCPPSMFQPVSSFKELNDILFKYNSQLLAVCPKSWYDPQWTNTTETLFTMKKKNTKTNSEEYIPRPGRPALVISSTSWTEDEDFEPLLQAAQGLDKQITERQSSLKVLVVVTGKGPQRGYYQELISKLKLQNVAIQTIWLEPMDYPKLLACADLGISLHTSTSGLDLPMKILDMFGCRVPVVAKKFPSLKELVQDDENGRIFDTPLELQQHLWYLLQPLDKMNQNQNQYEVEEWAPHSFGELARYSDELQEQKRWSVNWKENALPAIQLATSQSSCDMGLGR